MEILNAVNNEQSQKCSNENSSAVIKYNKNKKGTQSIHLKILH